MILNRKKDVEELTGFLMSKNLEAENSFLKIKNEILEKEKINVVDKKIQLQSKYDKLDGKHCELLNENTILMIDYSDTFFENNNLKEIIFNNNTLINKLENTINDLITEQNRLHNIFKKNILSDDIKNELNKEIQNLSDQLLSYKTKLEKYNQKKKKYIIKTNELILENRELISINEDYNKTLSKLSLETANLTNLKKDLEIQNKKLESKKEKIKKLKEQLKKGLVIPIKHVGRNINIDLNITLAKSLKKIKKYEEINENLISYKLKENLTKKSNFFHIQNNNITQNIVLKMTKGIIDMDTLLYFDQYVGEKQIERIILNILMKLNKRINGKYTVWYRNTLSEKYTKSSNRNLHTHEKFYYTYINIFNEENIITYHDYIKLDSKKED